MKIYSSLIKPWLWQVLQNKTLRRFSIVLLAFFSLLLLSSDYNFNATSPYTNIILVDQVKKPDDKVVESEKQDTKDKQVIKKQLAYSRNFAVEEDSGFDLMNKLAAGPELPEILSNRDKNIYKQIFTLQQKNSYEEAEKEIGSLRNDLLLGYVLADRYTSSRYKPSEDELVKWLEAYEDHPQYNKVYERLNKINSETASLYENDSQKVLAGYGDNNGLSGKITRPIDKQNWGSRTKAKTAWKKMNEYLAANSISKAEKVMTSPRIQMLFEPLEIDVALWSIANRYMFDGEPAKAYKLISQSATRSGNRVPAIHWTTGLSAWKIGNTRKATEHFAKLANADKISNWQKSAGAFWAYRGYMKLGKRSEAKAMLAEAALLPHTFYGLLARHIMEGETTFNWDDKTALRSSDMRQLASVAPIRRSLALIETGRNKDAEMEMRRYYPLASAIEKKKIVALVEKMKMPALQVRMANVLKENQESADYAFYPIPHWEPKGGYKVEPALMFALMRHESGFNPQAKSKVGAVGLMQLMPATAKYIAERKNISFNVNSLSDPELNLTIAQEYVSYLLTMEGIDKNIIFFAAAYNAGPGKLMQWLEEIDYNDDPLLFIESIPVSETRNFVTQVLTNYWIYSERLNDGEGKTIKFILAGKMPNYNGPVLNSPTYLAKLEKVN